MASSPARSRFFATRNAIAKRKAANDAAKTAVPPAGVFKLTVMIVLRETLWGFKDDGSYSIDNARLLLSDGSEIDGATVKVDAGIAEDLDLTLLYVTNNVTGDAIVTDDGYRLTTMDQVEARQAA